MLSVGKPARALALASLAVIGAVLVLAVLSFNPGPASGQSAPAVTGVAVTSSPSANSTYALGETIRVTLTFGEAVDVTGTPRLKIDMDPAHWGEKWAAYESGSGTASLTFAHTVVQPNTSTQGIAVLANTLELNGGAIKSTAKEAAADLSQTGLGHDPNHKVDWQIQNSPATGAPTISGTAQVGETLTADTSGISDADGLANATFSYQWLADDADLSGATGSTYTLAAAEEGKAVKVRVSFTDDAGHAETLTSAATAAVAAATPPAVTGVAVSSTASADNTYGLGETIRVTLTFGEVVDVTGTPRLKIDMDPAPWGEKWAAYESGSGTTGLTFAHEVVQPNISTQGVAVLANTLDLNGGTIQSSATQANAALTHAGLAHDANHKVDWQRSAAQLRQTDTTPPTVVSASIASNGTTLTLRLSETGIQGTLLLTPWSVTADGTAATIVSGSYLSSAGTITFTVSPAVSEGQTVLISYDGGSGANRIRDAAGNFLAAFTDRAVTNNVFTVAIANTGQTAQHTDDAMKPAFTRDNAQAFTTGSHAHGYTLTKVGFQISITDGTPAWAVSAKIRKPDSDGRPGGDFVGTLTNPSDFSADVDLFTHAGLALDPNTEYVAIIDVDSTITTMGGNFVLESTTADDEDSVRLAGWSIANNRWARRAADTSWVATDERSSALKIAVAASETPDTTAPVALHSGLNPLRKTIAITFDEPLKTDTPASSQFSLQDSSGTDIASTAPSSVSIAGSVVTATFDSIPSNAAKIKYTPSSTASDNPLQDPGGNQVAAFSQAYSQGLRVVAKTGQPAGGAGLVNRDHRLPFTTGNHAGGYRLTRVDIDLTGTDSVPTYAVKLQDLSGNDLATFTNPSTLADGLNTFTLSTAHDLAANTTYRIVYDQSSASATFRPVKTRSVDEDDGSAPGWSISNVADGRSHDSTIWNDTHVYMRLALYAYEVVDDAAPVALHSGLNPLRKTIAITFDEPLETDTPASSQFSLQDSSGTDIASTAPSSVSIAGSVVTATFASIPSNAAKIKYTPSPTASDNPLQDAVGNRVAAFSQAYSQGLRVVGNTGQDSVSGPLANRDYQQEFTTGNHAVGYKLTRVDIDVAEAGVVPTFTVKLQDSSGSDLATFTKPSTLSAGLNTFTLSTAHDLAANTTYRILFDQSSASADLKIALASAADEDAGAAPGWSIANTVDSRARAATAWTTVSASLKLAVYAYQKQPAPTVTSATVDRTAKTVAVTFSQNLKTDTPAAAQFALQDSSGTDIASTAPSSVSISDDVVTATFSSIPTNAAKIKYTPSSTASDNPLQNAAGTEVAAFSRHFDLLVGNTGQEINIHAWAALRFDWAQGFTTGAHSEGYTLTSVDIRFREVTAQPGYTVSVLSADSSGNPTNTVVGTLTKPASLTAGAVNTFTGRITLAAGTKYFVVIDSSSSQTGLNLSLTPSDAEDSGGATGWSIDNSAHAREWNDTTTADWDLQVGVTWQLAIRGTVGTSGFDYGYVNGPTSLVVVFAEALDQNSRPAAGSFTISRDGTDAAASGIAFLGGKAVGLTFSSGFTSGQTVTVSYAKPNSNPLQFQSGDEVEDFSEEPVTNTAGDITAPALSSAVVEAATLTLTYDETLNEFSVPAASAFTVKVDGSAVGLAAAGPVQVASNGTTVTLTLASAVTNDQTVTLSYTRPGSNRLEDLRGNDAANLANRTVLNRPAVVLAYGSPAPSGDANLDGRAETYVQGDSIKVKVRFSEDVTVANRGSGGANIQVVLDVGGTEHTLNHISTSNNELEFGTRTVAAADSDTDGITIKRDGSGNLVRLSGTATIKSSSTSRDASLVASADLGVRAFARLVGNTGQSQSQVADVSRDRGQAFTTGSNARGYTLTVVTWAFTGSSTHDYEMELWSASSGGRPLSKLATLSKPPSIAWSNHNVFLAPGGGIALERDTTYFVLMDNASGSGSFVSFTGSYSEDAGSAQDWSIANYSIERLRGSTGDWVSVSNDVVRMTIRGYGGTTAQAAPLALVRGTNAAPTGTDFTATTQKDVALTFARTDFAITDSDGDALKEIQVVTLPDSAHGELNLDGTAIPSSALPRTVTRAELEQGKLTFDPVADFISSDTAIPTFTFKVVDAFGTAAASANTATINVIPGPPLLTAVAHGRTLALVYAEALDESSVPAAADFTVKVDGSEVGLTNSNPVRVSGQKVTLTLASSVTSANVVTVSYTKGTNSIRSAAQENDVADLVDQAVSTAAPAIRSAVISRAGTTMTIRLSEGLLEGSFVRTDWRYRTDNGGWRYPTGGSLDAGEGTVTLNFSTPVTWTQSLKLRYSSSGLRNPAGNRLATFSNQEVQRHVPPNAACTMGPGPDPRNPESPCGTGPHDPTTEPGAYKTINDHTVAEANQPPPPKFVRIDCSDQDPTSCTIVFKGWSSSETYRGYHDGQVLTLDVGSHAYRTYLWVDLEQDPESAATCGTRARVEADFVSTLTDLDENDEVSRGVSLSAPDDLPSGCAVKKWVAAVVLVRSGDRSHSGSTVAFHEP